MELEFGSGWIQWISHERKYHYPPVVPLSRLLTHFPACYRRRGPIYIGASHCLRARCQFFSFPSVIQFLDHPEVTVHSCTFRFGLTSFFETGRTWNFPVGRVAEVWRKLKIFQALLSFVTHYHYWSRYIRFILCSLTSRIFFISSCYTLNKRMPRWRAYKINQQLLTIPDEITEKSIFHAHVIVSSHVHR